MYSFKLVDPKTKLKSQDYKIQIQVLKKHCLNKIHIIF